MKRIIILILFTFSASLSAEQLKVCATVPELGALAKEIGGNRVSVTTFVRPQEDPHYIDARPSFIRAMNEADVYIQLGMELEIGYAPILLQQSRNFDIQIRQPGFIDASTVITARDVPQVQVDRSLGDVHPMGSPHYTTDPAAGLLIADLIRRRFKRIDPAGSSVYDANYKKFEKELSDRLFGSALSARVASQRLKMAELLHRGGYRNFMAFLRKNGLTNQVGGWLKQLEPVRSQKYVGDHRATWAYFASTFGLTIPYNMEKVAGVEPSTSHLAKLAEWMKQDNVRYILSSAYYHPRYANFLAEKSGAKILPMANQVDSREGTSTYIDFIDYNVSLVARNR